MVVTHYELEIIPDWNGYDDVLQEKLKGVAMNKACSPFPVVDQFGRLYTAFCSYRLAIEAAVQARLLCDCSIHVYPFEDEGDIHLRYALVPQQDNKEKERACFATCTACGKQTYEDNLVVCEDCGRTCCLECVRAEYRNFSYYNGNVDIVPVCLEGCSPTV